jgi:hypothetical protein
MTKKGEKGWRKDLLMMVNVRVLVPSSSPPKTTKSSARRLLLLVAFGKELLESIKKSAWRRLSKLLLLVL